MTYPNRISSPYVLFKAMKQPLTRKEIKAQKRAFFKEIIEFENIYENLFPGQKLQERTENFFDYYVQIGNNFIPELIQNLDPLKKSFTILEF